MPEEKLFGNLKDFNFEIERLQSQYEHIAAYWPSTEYKDGDARYVGWAVTSRDGSVSDGVKRIPLKQPSDQRRPRGNHGTEIFAGPLKEIVTQLLSCGLSPSRIRLMTLAAGSDMMRFHTDSDGEAWRLHVPIFTTFASYFQWQDKNGNVVQKHFPADGRAWLVRVDIPHRAVNLAPGPNSRTHLLMSLAAIPSRALFGDDTVTIRP